MFMLYHFSDRYCSSVYGGGPLCILHYCTIPPLPLLWLHQHNPSYFSCIVQCHSAIHLLYIHLQHNLDTFSELSQVQGKGRFQKYNFEMNLKSQCVILCNLKAKDSFSDIDDQDDCQGMNTLEDFLNLLKCIPPLHKAVIMKGGRANRIVVLILQKCINL